MLGGLSKLASEKRTARKRDDAIAAAAKGGDTGGSSGARNKGDIEEDGGVDDIIEGDRQDAETETDEAETGQTKAPKRPRLISSSETGSHADIPIPAEMDAATPEDLCCTSTSDANGIEENQATGESGVGRRCALG